MHYIFSSLLNRVTEAQMKIVDKYDKLAEKDIAQSHFFHTDTSGRKYSLYFFYKSQSD